MRLLSIVESIPARDDGKYPIGASGVYAVFGALDSTRNEPGISMVPMADGFETEVTGTDRRGQDRATGEFIKVVALITVSKGTGRENELLIDVVDRRPLRIGRFLGIEE
jgi:hypothetical protein